MAVVLVVQEALAAVWLPVLLVGRVVVLAGITPLLVVPLYLLLQSRAKQQPFKVMQEGIVTATTAHPAEVAQDKRVIPQGVGVEADMVVMV